jgi:DNA-binding MarR family transcriptional regulator
MKPLARITPATVDVLTSLLEETGSRIWGLEIVRRCSRPPGSVYPILERLERSGWVESAWEDDDARPGPRRRLYELTADGAAAARATVASFAAKTSSAGARQAHPLGSSA